MSAKRTKPRAIDRSAFEPAYMQLVHILSEQIASGLYRPGDKLPPESELRAQYSVSPMTVRRVINILIERGLVSTTQGKGTFVKPLDMGEAVFRLQELKEHWAHDEQATVQLLEASIRSADERVARKLSLSPGVPTIFIRRLVSHQAVPTLYHREYLIYDPRRPVVEAQLQITSLEGLFQGQSSEGLRRGDLQIEAVNLMEEEACLLQVQPGTAAFYLEHIFYDFKDRPVSWGWFICRADHFKLTTCIGAEAER